jgi:transcriptional regulator with XRE-family HTH domain
LDRSIISSFGTVLRRLRRERSLTQEGLGLRANVQRKHISHLELGEKEVSLTTMYKLAHALKLSPAKLIALVDRELKSTQAAPTNLLELKN